MNKGTGLNAKEMIQRVEGQLKSMKMEYFDYYAYHGINNLSTWQAVCATEGAWKIGKFKKTRFSQTNWIFHSWPIRCYYSCN